MWTKHLVQACVVGLEMAREPSVESRTEFGAGYFMFLEIIHDIANFIEQPLMVGLMLGQLIVAMLPHK